MPNSRTGEDYLDRELLKNKKNNSTYLKAAHQDPKEGKSTQGGYMSRDREFYPELQPQYQEPNRRRLTAVHPKDKSIKNAAKALKGDSYSDTKTRIEAKKRKEKKRRAAKSKNVTLDKK